MSLYPSNVGCGVACLGNLNRDTFAILTELMSPAHNLSGGNAMRSASVLMFSDNINYGHGARLAKYVIDNKLGTIVVTENVPNVVYAGSHKISVWLWTVDWPAVKSHWETLKGPNIERWIAEREKLLELDEKKDGIAFTQFMERAASVQQKAQEKAAPKAQWNGG